MDLHTLRSPEIWDFNWKLDKWFLYMDIEKNFNAVRSKEGVSCLCIFVYLGRTKHKEIDIHFCHAQKHVTKRMWYEYHS